MEQPILVTRGTGAPGSCRGRPAARRRARSPSDEPSRGAGGTTAAGRGWATADLLTGAGVDAAVRDVDVVVHCATSVSGPKEIRAMRTLVGAARRAGCAHLVYVSIVGVDRRAVSRGNPVDGPARMAS